MFMLQKFNFHYSYVKHTVMNLSADAAQHVLSYLTSKEVHKLSQSCKEANAWSRMYFRHPFRRGKQVSVDRFGQCVDTYRVVCANHYFVYMQPVTYSFTARRHFDNGECEVWNPVRYENPFAKFSFFGKGALKHGEWTVKPVDSMDPRLGRILA